MEIVQSAALVQQVFPHYLLLSRATNAASFVGGMANALEKRKKHWFLDLCDVFLLSFYLMLLVNMDGWTVSILLVLYGGLSVSFAIPNRVLSTIVIVEREAEEKNA